MAKIISLGERIRELRELKDISLRELAKKIDVSAAFLSDVELGRRNFSEEKFGKIAKALGVSEAELKQYDASPPLNEMRKLVAEDPRFGLAFRRIIDEETDPDELMKFINKISDKKKDP
jgi:transcriptional regulator with XRE-family HTH domain